MSEPRVYESNPNQRFAPDAEDASMDSEAWGDYPARNSTPAPKNQEEAPDEDQVQETQSEEGEDEESPADAAEETEVQTPTDADVQVGPRANRRIQSLVAERNDARSALAEMQATNDGLRAALERQVALQEKAFAHQQSQWTAQQAVADARRMEEEAAKLGFRPELVEHQYMLGVGKHVDSRVESITKRLEAFEQQQQQAAQQAVESQWNSALDQVFASKLSTFDVTPKQIEGLKKQALAIAIAYQVNDPVKAAESALDTVRPMLKAKTNRPATPRGVQPGHEAAHDAISMSGKSGGRKPGSTASGRQPKESFVDFERRALGGRKGRF